MTRELTPNETKVVQLVKMFDEAANSRKMTVTLVGSQLAAEIVAKLETNYGICRVLKVDYRPSSQDYSITFTMTEFRKYMEYMLKVVELTLCIDGSLKTFDNLTITDEYLN